MLSGLCFLSQEGIYCYIDVLKKLDACRPGDRPASRQIRDIQTIVTLLMVETWKEELRDCIDQRFVDYILQGILKAIRREEYSFGL